MSSQLLPQSLSENVSLHFPAAHVAVVTIERAEARNAVNGSVAVGLDKAVEQTENDPDIWAIVLTGAGGKAFSAGADLKEISAGRVGTLRTERGGFAGFVSHARDKPWIAAVEGFALAGGFEIALACDLIVASEQSTFGLPEPSRGLIAAAGGLYRLPRALPRNVALELIATGAQIDASRAYALGLVNRLVAVGAALASAIALAAQICANSPAAVRESLKVARIAADFDSAAVRELTVDAVKRLSETADYREGPRAFIEKRAPKWSGK